jgi:hypothetical protein
METKTNTRAGTVAILLLLLMVAVSLPARGAFVHPGGLHTQADFDRMAAKVAAGEQPWKATWDKLIADPHAQLTWNPAAVSCICRTGSGNCTNNYTLTQEDAHAIYSLALRYRVTDDKAYADRAIYIMDAWSSTLTGFCGDQHVSLAAGHIGYLFAVGGEALRGYSGWSQSSQDAWANMLVTHFYPLNRDFLFRHHGTCPGHYRLNWFTCNMASMIAIGVFADREDIFDEAVAYFIAGPGNGNIFRAAWYIHEDGLAQAEESGRDPGHDWTGWDNLTIMCEIAWNQGVDLWGYDNNRMLRALEYNAKHNLGHGVPFAPYVNCSVHYETNNYGPNSGFGPHSWERAYNHYVNRKGLAAPYVSQVASRLRPDGPPNNYSTHPSRFDWLGLGSLTFYRDPIAAGATPSGLVAKVSRYRVDLTWWGSAYAKSYNIKRATASGGPYSTIAVVGSTDTHYVDAGIIPGTTYYYVISANNPSGEGANSAEVTAAVFPWLWTHLKFDESSGTAALDSSGNGWDGTLMNNATWAAGRYGNAVSLSSASSQYVTQPAGANGAEINLTDFSVSTWVNLGTVDTWARIFDHGMDKERYMFLTPKSGGGVVRFAMTQGSGRGEKAISGPTALGTGWQHVAVTGLPARASRRSMSTAAPWLATAPGSTSRACWATCKAR